MTNTLNTTEIKIVTGKRYVLRNGIITDAIKLSANGTNYVFEATIQEPEHKTKTVACWLKNGSYLTTGENHKNDIVKEYEKQYTGTYKVCKIFRKSNRRQIIRRGLTRDEAKALVNSYPDSNTSMVVFDKQFYSDKYYR